MSEWIQFQKIPYSPFGKFEAPYDGKPFLACVWGEWVGEAIYARHYDSTADRIPMKYEFFYITQNPEEEGWKVRTENDPFPITHWMPMPKGPNA
jgi:hypothetical protein